MFQRASSLFLQAALQVPLTPAKRGSECATPHVPSERLSDCVSRIGRSARYNFRPPARGGDGYAAQFPTTNRWPSFWVKMRPCASIESGV